MSFFDKESIFSNRQNYRYVSKNGRGYLTFKQSTRANNMSTDEKLAEIANLIESLLKKNGKFLTLDYSTICFDYISNDVVTSYRKKMHYFRHATDDAISERKTYSEEQKSFFLDYGLTIVKVIHSLLK